MRRREFIAFVGCTAAAWPLAARAQQRAMPVIGFLRSTTAGRLDEICNLVPPRPEGNRLRRGREYRYADNQLDRLSVLVTDLVRLSVAVIVVNAPAARVAKDATTTVPIVFATGADPVKDALVASLNRPSGNVTGVTFLAGQLGAKRLELLRQLVPKATTIVLVNPSSPETEEERKDLQVAAQAIGQQLIILDVSNDRDIETAFATFVQRGAGALLVGSGPFLTSHREQLVALAARDALPAAYDLREFVVAGGLMSYGTSITDAYRQVGIYTSRNLKGEKPADLPVMQSAKFEFVINLKTAKALNLTVPQIMQMTADEVIE